MGQGGSAGSRSKAGKRSISKTSLHVNTLWFPLYRTDACWSMAVVGGMYSTTASLLMLKARILSAILSNLRCLYTVYAAAKLPKKAKC